MAVTAPGNVVVTGASRGIGRAVAEALLARGATVAVVARSRDALAALAERAPDRVRVCAADLADPVARRRLPSRLATELGRIDGLVQCAGIARHAPAGEIREEDLEATLATNFTAPLLLAQAIAGLMRAQGGGGSIVQVASTLGLAPAAGTAAYAASKAALIAATRALALDLAPHRIRVNAVAPGLVRTDMLRGRPLDELAELHPLGRLGEPEEIADAVLHLLDAPWTTGTVLVVDGGLTAGTRRHPSS